MLQRIKTLALAFLFVFALLFVAIIITAPEGKINFLQAAKNAAILPLLPFIIFGGFFLLKK